MDDYNISNNKLAIINNAPIGSLEAYLAFVNRIPVLSKEQEIELLDEMRNGSINAARQLIMSHLRFVVHVARGYKGYGLGLADLIQEGNVGLMEAVKRFNPQAGVRLVTFAVYWIKSKINDFVLKNWRIVKVATTKAHKKLFFNLRSMKKNWFDKNDVDYICSSLNVTKKDVETMISRLYASDTQLIHDFEEQNESEVQQNNYSLVADTTYAPDQDTSYDPKMTQSVAKCVAQLDERSKTIIQARWLNEDKKVTLTDLAKDLNISHERVRQLEKEALAKLKRFLNTH